MEKPFTIDQDSGNSLQIIDANGEQLCQFYCEAIEVDEATWAKAEFVLRAVNA